MTKFISFLTQISNLRKLMNFLFNKLPKNKFISLVTLSRTKNLKAIGKQAVTLRCLSLTTDEITRDLVLM